MSTTMTDFPGFFPNNYEMVPNTSNPNPSKRPRVDTTHAASLYANPSEPLAVYPNTITFGGGGGFPGHVAALPARQAAAAFPMYDAMPGSGYPMYHFEPPLSAHKSCREISGVLEIVEQPTKRGRFRYDKEGRRTPLPGRTEGSFPSVRVAEQHRDMVLDGTPIQATVVTRQDGEDGLPRPHWHRLEGKVHGDLSVSQPLVCGSAMFGGLVVIRADKSTFETHWGPRSAEDQQVIRIMFTVYFKTLSGERVQSRVVSEPVFGCELKIQHMSHHQVPMLSGEDITLLTTKIKLSNIAVIIVDEYTGHGFAPNTTIDSINGWKVDQDGKIYCVVPPKLVHHQFALVAHLPQYWEPTAKEPRPLTIRLLDNVQKMESNYLSLQYIPSLPSFP